MKFKPESSDYLSPSHIQSSSKDLRAIKSLKRYYNSLWQKADQNKLEFNLLIEASRKRGKEIDAAVEMFFSQKEKFLQLSQYNFEHDHERQIIEYYETQIIESIELPVYDDLNAIRGRYDVITTTTGKRIVNDNKSMSSVRKLDYLDDYFQQLSFYRSNLDVDGSRIVAYVDGLPEIKTIELPEHLVNFNYNNLLRKADILRKCKTIEIETYKDIPLYLLPDAFKGTGTKKTFLTKALQILEI